MKKIVLIVCLFTLFADLAFGQTQTLTQLETELQKVRESNNAIEVQIARLQNELKSGQQKEKQMSQQLLKRGTVDFSKLISDWQRFYKEIFGKSFNFSNLPIPNAPAEYSWLVINHPDVSIEEVLSGGKDPQRYLKWPDRKLDDLIDHTFGRDALIKPYIVRCRPNIEADENLKNMSANMIASQSINTLTLKERLLLGRFLWWKKQIILDKNTITLCSGSRSSGGSVPHMSWFVDVLLILWDSPDKTFGRLRVRRIVF